jgi:hypothetical protein
MRESSSCVVSFTQRLLREQQQRDCLFCTMHLAVVVVFLFGLKTPTRVADTHSLSLFVTTGDVEQVWQQEVVVGEAVREGREIAVGGVECLEPEEMAASPVGGSGAGASAQSKLPASSANALNGLQSSRILRLLFHGLVRMIQNHLRHIVIPFNALVVQI